MGDLLAVLLTVLLIASNAFFVGAEFALISARRDRLEALAEQGKRSQPIRRMRKCNPSQYAGLSDRFECHQCL